jgi:hypothetical protein
MSFIPLSFLFKAHAAVIKTIFFHVEYHAIDTPPTSFRAGRPQGDNRLVDKGLLSFVKASTTDSLPVD